jgi:hypothetical protein
MQASVSGVSVSGKTEVASVATWMEVLDEATGRNFWFNADTGDSTWTTPFPTDPTPDLDFDATADADADNAWEVKHDPATNREFYWNNVTQESLWEDPRGRSTSVAASTMAAPTSDLVDPVLPSPGLACLDSSGDWQVCIMLTGWTDDRYFIQNYVYCFLRLSHDWSCFHLPLHSHCDYRIQIISNVYI